MKLLFKKTSFVIFLAIFIFSGLYTNKKAEAWFGQEALIRTMLDAAYHQMKGAMTGATKQVATMASYVNMTNFLKSDGGGFIKSFPEYLEKEPDEKADNWTNDLISQTIGGKGGDGYKSFGGNYRQNLAQAAKAQTTEKKKPEVDYEGDPSQMFSQGEGFRSLGNYTDENKSNYPTKVVREIKDLDIEKREKEKNIARTAAISNEGFKPVGGIDNVSIPAATRRADLDSVRRQGGLSIVNSNEISEVIVTSFINASFNQYLKESLSS